MPTAADTARRIVREASPSHRFRDAIRLGLNADDEQQIDDLQDAVRMAHGNCPAGWGLGEEFGVLDRQAPAVCQKQLEWLKWPCLPI